MAVKIVFCYSHEDEVLLNKLKSHLSPLQRQNLIEIWYDRDITLGTNWQLDIDRHIENSQLILLLVSPDFINSDYCYNIEMARAIELHKQGRARVVPVILRYSLWQQTPLGNLQVVPKDGKPVTSWSDIDEAFYNVAEGIRKIAVKLSPKSFTSSTSFVQYQQTPVRGPAPAQQQQSPLKQSPPATPFQKPTLSNWNWILRLLPLVCTIVFLIIIIFNPQYSILLVIFLFVALIIINIITNKVNLH